MNRREFLIGTAIASATVAVPFVPSLADVPKDEWGNVCFTTCDNIPNDGEWHPIINKAGQIGVYAKRIDRAQSIMLAPAYRRRMVRKSERGYIEGWGGLTGEGARD